jgi:diguanylate cyclase (GGDEF)-like protein/PAS domain S-box-containing protein
VKRFIGLETKMSIVVSLLVAVLMVALAFPIIYYFEMRFRDTIVTQQYALVTEMARDIDNTIRRTQETIVAKAAAIPGEAATDFALAQRLLNSESDLYTTFDNGVYIFSVTGRMIAEYPDQKRQGRDYSYREYFRKTIETGKPYISAPFFSSKAHHHPAVMLTAPLYGENGKIVAILGGSIDLTKDNILGEHARTKIGKTGYVYIYDTDRTMIMHPDRSRILMRDVPPGANRVFDKGIAGFNGTEETVNSRGLHALTSVRRLDTTNWILAANYPLQEAYAPIRSTLRFSILAVIAGVLASVLIVSLSMKFFTAPLCKLTDHIRKISGSGGAEQEILIDSKDEIEELATAFNSMMKNLESKKKEMDRISQEYTLEIAAALADAQEERARSEAFVAAIGDTTSVQDTEFRIIYQNPAMMKVMGDHVGEYCYRAYAGKDSICPGCLMVDAFRDGKLHRGEQEFVHVDGRRAHLEFTVSPVRDASGRIVAAIELVRDISERKLVEWRFAAQHALNSILAESPTVGEAIPRVLKAICEAIDWEVGGVWWVDGRKEVLQLLDMWCHPELDVALFEAMNRAMSFSPNEGLPGRVWVSGDPAWISDVQRDENFPRHQAAVQSGLHGAFAFPIVLGRAVVGVMEFFSSEVREPDPGLLDAIAPLGSQLGLLIERKWDEQSLRESERRFRETLENIQLLAVELDPSCRVLFCNDFLLSLTGWTREEVLGRNWFEIFTPDNSVFAEQFFAELADGSLPRHGEYEIVTRSGERRSISWNRTILYGSDGTVSGVASIGEDITERKKAEAELIYLNCHEPLTGLYNRAFFDEELKRLSCGRQFPVSIITIDVDGLKKVNDTLGHEAGDRLIRKVALVLLKAFRAEDVVARIGGDEFAVLLPETDTSDAEAAVGRIRKCQDDANRADTELCLSMSIGAATAKESQEISSAQKLSDERMYLEKFARKKVPPPGSPGVLDCMPTGK